ncbi:MAG: dTMP kinase [Treponema sp.]|jgi:dTMP kinase|nr:dTMP kinase [Treponema sp.]
MVIIHNFAVFEGGDGSGTTTQLELLSRRFTEPGLPPFHAASEPSGGPVGVLLRKVLKGEITLRPETAARLFAADRNEHLYGPGGIVERCARGGLVVSDRYTPSSLVYQGITCGDQLPASLNGSFPLPELLIFFDLAIETALNRMASRPKKDIYEYRDFQIKVRSRYKALLPRYAEAGVRVECLDASLPPAEIADQVWRAVRKMPILEKGRGVNP